LNLITILGGTRVVNIRPLQVTLVAPRLEILVSEEGDFSDYTLALGWKLQADGTYQPPTGDRPESEHGPGCTSDASCECNESSARH